MHAVIKFINIKSEIRISLEFNSLTNFVSVSRTVERVELVKTQNTRTFSAKLHLMHGKAAERVNGAFRSHRTRAANTLLSEIG